MKACSLHQLDQAGNAYRVIPRTEDMRPAIGTAIVFYEVHGEIVEFAMEIPDLKD